MSPLRSPIIKPPPLRQILEGSGEVAEIVQTRLTTQLGRTPTPREIDDFLEDSIRAGGSTESRTRLLDGLKDGLGDEFNRAIGATRRGASVNEFTGVPLDVIAPEHSKGFVIKEINDSYEDWVRREATAWDDLDPATRGTKDDWLSRERFVQKVSRGKARMLLDLLLGPNPGTRMSIPRTVRKTKHWRSVNHDWVNEAPLPGSRQAIVDLVKNREKLREKVVEVLTHTNNEVLARGGSEVDDSVEFILTYLERRTPAGGLEDMSPEHLVPILGQKKELSPRDFVHSVLEARNSIERSMELIGEAQGNRSLWSIRGIEGALDGAVQKTGYEKGFVFELELTVELEDLAGRPGALAGKTVDTVIVQVRIGGKSGPDWVIISTGGRAIIAQAKSFDSHTNLVGFTGAYFKQFSSDLRRLWRESTELAAKHGEHDGMWRQGEAPKINMADDVDQPWRTLDEDYHFYADEGRMQENAHKRGLEGVDELDESEMAEGVMDVIESTDRKIKQSDAALNDWVGDVSRYLDPSMMDSKQARDWILDNSSQKVPKTQTKITQTRINSVTGAKSQVTKLDPNTGRTIAEFLEDATKNQQLVETIRRRTLGLADGVDAPGVNLTGPVTARELFALRVAIDPKTGVIDASLVARILGMDPPFKVHHHMHMPALSVT